MQCVAESTLPPPPPPPHNVLFIFLVSLCYYRRCFLVQYRTYGENVCCGMGSKIRHERKKTATTKKETPLSPQHCAVHGKTEISTFSVLKKPDLPAPAPPPSESFKQEMLRNVTVVKRRRPYTHKNTHQAMFDYILQQQQQNFSAMHRSVKRKETDRKSAPPPLAAPTLPKATVEAFSLFKVKRMEDFSQSVPSSVVLFQFSAHSFLLQPGK